MRREYKGRAARIVKGVIAAIILFNLLYLSTALERFGMAVNLRWLVMPGEVFNAVHLSLMATISFILYRATKKSPKDRLPWYDMVLIALALGSNLYFAIFYNEVITEHFSYGIITPTELVLGLVVIAVMMEAGRRVIGIWMPLLALLFFIYPLIGHSLPDFLQTRAHTLDNVVRHAGPAPQGMYGSMVTISSTVVVAFIFFGMVLQSVKASQFFTNIAISIFGRLSGGPALAAVAASAAFGSIAPASAANAAATGVITIPLMKDIGMKPRFAAAVEAVAANGGSILPPVMSSAAFIMADFLGISYWEIVIAAFVPGLLYYAAIWIGVYVEARRLGIQGLPRQKMPSLKKAVSSGWQFLIPVAILVWFLAYSKYSPQMSAVYATLALIVVSMLRKDTRFTWRRFVSSLFDTGATMVLIAPLFALASVMVASLDFTGLALRLSTGLVALSGGNILTLLILAAICAIILGMPLNASATYIILAVLVAPALTKLGVSPIAAHLFLLWFALSGPITPPSCAACFVTAAIAGEGSAGFSVGWLAMRLAAIAYILPFTFVYNPALLLIGNSLEVGLAIVTALLGVTLLASGMRGWFLKKVPPLVRAVLVIAGLLFIWPGWINDIIGLILAVPLAAYIVLKVKEDVRKPVAETT